MIYLQRCCCCVDLRMGTIVVGILHILFNILTGVIVTLFGEMGHPDACQRLYIIFTMIHILSCVFLIIGSFRLRSSWMLFYILMTMIQILAFIILIIADVILRIWFWVIIIYALLIPVTLYFWLVAYSFYAALGGALFI
ncbi:uncharacterized protein [Drosophila kikkawai]|uniref:Uncharacterized protein n=1 Tax=Drosophila kikkawai TaxID=30033 RepID=A0A6P4JF16_DROKI|nr:uncharacterized protein LOC108082352 [Drosophila kikkawai]